VWPFPPYATLSFLCTWSIFWSGIASLSSLRLQQRLYPVLPPLHRSEDRAGLPVSFPKGMVSCKPGMSPCHFRRDMDEPRTSPCPFYWGTGLLLRLLCCCRGREIRPWRWVGRFCLCSWSIPWSGLAFFSVWCVSCMAFSEGMVSWGEMSCAHGSAVKVYAACLLRPQFRWLSVVPLTQWAWCEFLLLSL